MAYEIFSIFYANHKYHTIVILKNKTIQDFSTLRKRENWAINRGFNRPSWSASAQIGLIRTLRRSLARWQAPPGNSNGCSGLRNQRGDHSLGVQVIPIPGKARSQEAILTTLVVAGEFGGIHKLLLMASVAPVMQPDSVGSPRKAITLATSAGPVRVRK